MDRWRDHASRGALIFGVILTAAMAGLLFGSAGRWDVPQFWVYLGIWLVFWTVTFFTMDPDLMKERLRPAGESLDSLLLLRLLGLVVVIGQWVLAGLDVGRTHWSDTVPLALQVVGGVVFVAALAVVRWAQDVNPYFSSAIRIQRDRGHHVVTTGPYAYIRHPGYAAFILGWSCGGLMLGSWWALLPAVIFAAAFVRRAAVEDCFLQAELEGYAEYASKVRYRLVPGLW